MSREENQKSTNDLSGLLELIKGQFTSPAISAADPSQLRYALYARKSTENEDRQVQSIPDQIKDCIELVIKPHKISFNPSTDVFKEQKSAKEAGTRPEFSRMMKMISEGKYDGVIAWHYDRLARNMKEAGEIIDFIDRGLIKDLKLAKATFENTPNGKMILGISFVLSKHYSDHLSESVQRGTDSRTQQGVILKKQVHGYRITTDRKLIADGENYLLIEKAFRLRLDGKSLKEIANYLNDTSYQVFRRSTGHKSVKFDVDMISKILKDPIYTGINVYGKQAVVVAESDPDFTPMITPDEYKQLNGSKLSYVYTQSQRTAPNEASNFLRNFVICGHCNRPMGTSITTKAGKLSNNMAGSSKQSYFRFICRSTTCEMKNSGPRGSVILDYAINYLTKHSFTTEANYQRYREDAEFAIQKRLDDLSKRNKSLTTQVSIKKREYNEARSMAADKSNPASIHYTPTHLDNLKSELDHFEAELMAVRTEIDRKQSSIKSYDQFVELYKNTADLLRSTTGLGLSDSIIRIFFSNFTVKGTPYGLKMKQKQWSVIDHCLREPFDEFVKNGEFLSWSG